MKLTNPYVPPEKLTRYLLVWHEEDDKSGYLALAGFTEGNPEELREALLLMAQTAEAVEIRRNDYGVFFAVQGVLRGPNGVVLQVRTIWILRDDGRSHLVTLIPLRRRQ